MPIRNSPAASALRALALVMFISATAFGQTPLGRVVGTVLDQSGAVLPGATVTLTNAGTGQVQTTTTTQLGAFVFPQMPVGTYTLTVALPTFKTAEYTDVIVTVGQEYSLTARLDVGALTETVRVMAGESLVKTTTPEVSSTVNQAQVLNMPLANRDVTNLIKMQPGVQAFINRTNTSVNGGRPTWTQVTLDGINIQDNFIRVNGLDFLPNRPTSDNVAEFSITTAVAGADTAGGATTVRMVTPSGTNRFTGSVFEFHRDAKYSSNSFFNNASNVAKPALSRHQFGGRVGGPIVRNRLFFFGNYEGFRQTTQTSQNIVIPANADFSQGVFRYAATDGTVRLVNLLELTGLRADQKLLSDLISKLPAPASVNNFDVGDSRTGSVLNTGGYRFNQTDLNDRNQYVFRADYDLSQRHRFEGVYSYFKEIDDRTDLDLISPDRPLVYTSSDPKRFALAWRWTATGNFQNEIRGGANLAPVSFETDWDYASIGVLYRTPLDIINPIGGTGPTGEANTGVGFQAQGRNTNTYQLNDTASWLIGSHSLQMGGSWQRNLVNPYNFRGRFPEASFGFSPAAPASVQLNSAQFPGGISATDLGRASSAAAFLGGVISSVQQTFQVESKTSGFVPGIPANENYTLDNIAAYIQDNWRWKSNLTLRAGLKWEYYSPLRENDDLGFLPVLDSRSFGQVMLDPTSRVGFVDGYMYKKDLNNFGPTAGFAWDATRDGKTAVRGGYSLTFVNEDVVTVARAAARGNAGLSTTLSQTNLYTTVAAGVPVPATPAFLSERTLAQQNALSATGALWGIDPNIKQPYVHQVSMGVQREIGFGTAVEARYVGTFGREIWRGIDYNQMRISPEFLADFKRARSNGFLAQQAGLAFDPAFNAAVPGSQPLSVLPTFGATLLANATARNHIQTNQVAGLADFYIINRVAGALGAFMPNSGIYASQGIVNGAFTDYNSLQLEVRRQLRNGFFGQFNYTLSDTLTDSAGTAQNRLEAFMDQNRPELNTGRAAFHVTHVLSGNFIYELPFGEGRRWANRGGVLNQVLGGWQVASILAWQSGSPISFFSGRGTVNRPGRSSCLDPAGPTACNTAVSNLSAAQIRDLLGIYKVENRIYWIDPKVIDAATGRAVGADNLTNAPGFEGQVFLNPAAGETGNLPILAFDGPSQFRIDLALSKRFRFGGRYGFEVKGEGFNLTNTPSFFRGDIDINSTTFGRLTSVNVASRVVQLSARFDF
jgi:hypothetical protein